MRSADYLAINSMGKGPAIVHGGRTITECVAICAYLADAFPAANLTPPTDRRADYYRWLFFAAGPVEAAVINKALGFVVPEGRKRTAGYGTFDTLVDPLEHAVSGPGWICVGQFPAAHAYCGSKPDWGLTFRPTPHPPP